MKLKRVVGLFLVFLLATSMIVTLPVFSHTNNGGSQDSPENVFPYEKAQKELQSYGEEILSINDFSTSGSFTLQELFEADSNTTSSAWDVYYEKEPNDTLSQANLIHNNHIGDFSSQVNGTITGHYTDMDYFRFDVPTSGEFDISAFWSYGSTYYNSYLEEELLIGLFDSYGNIISAGLLYGSYGSMFRNLQASVDAGTYYLLVLQDDTYKYLLVGEPYVAFVDFYHDEPEYVNLQVSHEGRGSSSPANGNHKYIKGTNVQLNASANRHWSFDKWVLNNQAYYHPSITLSLNHNYTAIAYFSLQDYVSEHRLSGRNRYMTSQAIAKANYTDSDTVIIVRGDGPANAPNVVDALSASGLAGAHQAPILLTHPTRLLDDTASAIASLNATKAIIVGGDGAVSPAVEQSIKSLGLQTRRIRVEGGDRFSTAAEVAYEIVGNHPGNTAIIAGGTALVDSLVAGPLAHEMKYPILLVGQSIPQSTKEFLVQEGIENLIIIGGTGVVSESVEVELNQLVQGNVNRVSGVNRFETSIAIANEFFPTHEQAVLVNGVNFVDAVPASILGNPLLYVRENSISESVQGVLWTKADFIAVGGTSTISDEVLGDAYSLTKD